jgi:hypothetical protein
VVKGWASAPPAEEFRARIPVILMIGFAWKKPMKRRKDPTLKDERRAVYEAKLRSLREELHARDETAANRILGKKEWSNSVQAVSGGRPESNRSKF